MLKILMEDVDPEQGFAAREAQARANGEPPAYLHLHFRADRVADAIGISVEQLYATMVTGCQRALAIDALDLLRHTMAERGLRFGIDAPPDDWPDEYLVAVTLNRLFPGSRE